jgi:hypothetical protein
MTSVESHFSVGVVVAKRKLKGPWAEHAWLPRAVLPAVPAADPWASLGADGDDELFYAGPAEVWLERGATSHYGDNLTAAQPSVWVSLRPVGGDEVEVGKATVDPYEGESMAEAIGEVVEALAMPPEIQAKVAAFFEAFHVERPFIKRQRDRADPDGMGRRRRRGPGDDEP